MREEEVMIVLPIPVRVLHPNFTVGSFGGRMQKASATKRYRRLAKEAVLEMGIESMPWPHVVVEAAFFFKDKRRRDQDNAEGSLKAAYDGIVDSGIVEDDDYGHMTRLYSDFNVDKKFPRVEITITRREKK